MKIAIHYRKGSFSDRWITYCESKRVPYKLVNCYDSDIISQLSDCSGLMWHWSQNDYKAILFARQLTIALEKRNIKVFPDVNTAWHFDDKIGQKYLLEAIDAPLVPSYVFYSKSDALEWLDNVTFPKVFKLRGGAGSVNVSLVKSKKEAKKLINKAFGKGFFSINKLARLKDRFWSFKQNPNLLNFRGIISGFARIFIPLEIEKFSSRQKGYIYFQDFISKNTFDSRVIVIGNKCFAVRRYCRKNDFRASGSGIKAYEKDLFDEKMIKIAFNVAEKLKSQSVAFDFILEQGRFKIIEISYSFIIGSFYDDCHGYWDNNLVWHSKEVNPQYFMIENFINSLIKK